MPEPHKAEQIHKCYHTMTDAVVLLAKTNIQHPSMQAFIPLLRTHQEALKSACRFFNPNLDTAISSNTCSYTRIVADLSALLTALQPQLSKLSTRLTSTKACMIGSSEEHVFWELWKCLVTGFVPFFFATHQWLGIRGPDKLCVTPSLHPVFYNLLTWLLSMSRSTVWLAMEYKHGLQSRNNDLLMILSQISKYMYCMTVCLPQAFAIHLNSLHPECFPLLCCILSEQCTSVPSLILPPPKQEQTRACVDLSILYPLDPNHQSSAPPVAVLEVLCKVVMVVNNLLLHIWDTNEGLMFKGDFAFLTSPSVSHLLKAALLSPEVASLSGLILMRGSIASLVRLLEHNIRHSVHKSLAGLPFTPQQQTTNRDDLGLPLHANPHFSLPALETDRLLLNLLGLHIQQERGGLAHVERCLFVQAMVLKGWLLAGEHCPAHSEVMSEMVSSVIGVARQWTETALQLGRSLRTSPSKAPDHASQHETQKSMQQKQRRDTKAVCMPPVLRCPTALPYLRLLMYLTSNFAVQCHDNIQVYSDTGHGSFSWKLWVTTPGLAAATEALQRGENYSNTADELTQVATSTWGVCGVVCLQGMDPSGFCKRTSLTATVRKLIRAKLRAVSIPEKQLGQQKPTVGSVAREQLESSLHDMTQLMPMLANAVQIMGKWNTKTPRGTEERSGSGSSSSNHKNDSHLETAEDNDKPLYTAQPSHQLQAILLLTLLEVCVWMQQVTTTQGRTPEDVREWLMVAYTLCAQLVDPHLRSMAISIFGEASVVRPKSQKGLCVAWERYTVLHCHGKLLPGCCNLGCTNFDGVSEAALKTLLCGGCRQARYCSIGCQRAAWLEGGHREVCMQKGAVDNAVPSHM